MKGDRIPDVDHIARYCGGATVHEDGSIDGVAFRLRGGETFLSVNWLEYLDPADRNRQLTELRRVFLDKNFSLRKTARFAVLNVGGLCEHVRRESADRRGLQVIHEPAADDLSHSGIFGLQPEDDVIADLIAEEVREVHPAQAT